jgi:hypothetical protein
MVFERLFLQILAHLGSFPPAITARNLIFGANIEKNLHFYKEGEGGYFSAKTAKFRVIPRK